MWESIAILEMAKAAFTIFMVLWIVSMMHLLHITHSIIDEQRDNFSTKWRKSYLRWRTGMFVAGWAACVAVAVRLLIENSV